MWLLSPASSWPPASRPWPPRPPAATTSRWHACSVATPATTPRRGPRTRVASPLRIGQLQHPGRRVDAGLLGRRARLPAVRRRRRSPGDQLQGQGAWCWPTWPAAGWDFYRQYRTNILSHPHQGGAEQEPVLWRSDRFVCTYAGPVAAVRASTASTVRSRRSATDALLHGRAPRRPGHVVSGLAIINVHLIPGAVMGGLAGAGASLGTGTSTSPARRSVVAAAEQQQGCGRVFVLGDFNSGWLQDEAHRHKHLPIRSFGAIGFRSMWATENPGKGRGSAPGGLIDQVWDTTRRPGAPRCCSR